ncbi:hypothetical protein BDV12DRAFT_195654 [Aspergillus spectabilis]
MRKESLLTEVSAFAQVQNLLFVFVFATLHDVRIANTWEIIRQAMRACVKYDFHSRETADNDLLREQLRRRIFWSAYISDRYSSQNLGRPVALLEDDITIDLPINQDDGLIEAGEPETPGQYTEVTNLLRHTLLRRLGTNAQIALNRWARQRAPLTDQIETASTWTSSLEAWYNSSAVKPTPTNAYETKEYLDINFHRERMKFLSYLVLPSDTQKTAASIEHLWEYTLSAYQILLVYQKQSSDGFLAPNWTYVQDVLKPGFGILYCAVGIPEQRRRNNEDVGLLRLEINTVVNALKLCGETLSQITAQWQTVKRHAAAFMQISEAVLELVASTTRVATGNQRQTDLGSTMPADLEEVLDWDFATLDSTLDMFHGGTTVPFTDAETISELEAENAAAVGAERPHPDPTHATPGWTENEARGADVNDAGPEPGLTSMQGQATGLGLLADLNTAPVYDYENHNLKRMLTRALVLKNDTLNLHPGKHIRKTLSLSNSLCDGQSPIHHLPNDFLTYYIERYFEHVNPTFPILAAGDINTTLQFLENGLPVGPSEICLLYLVLAVGAVFPSTDSLLDASAAVKLWLAASKEQVFDDESENTVRIFILLVLFSLLEEGCGSSWHLVELLPSKLLYNMFAVDLRIARAAQYILREGRSAALRFERIASDQLSAVEIAVKRGSTLPWTNGYTTLVSVMIRLISFGQTAKYRLLFAQCAPEPDYIPRALDIIRLLGRTLKSLECLGNVLDRLHQLGTETVSGSTETTIGIPRHSKIYNITSWALRSIGVSWC